MIKELEEGDQRASDAAQTRAADVCNGSATRTVPAAAVMRVLRCR